ncbi:MAG: hypothetical protein KF797_08020 [Flavobacteriales bacterium]|nr:hypothetical protein [Flavobacteriales bacterium]
MRSAFLSLLAASLFCFAASPVQGQTFFYISSISVEPGDPTTNDAISISLHGDLSSSGARIVSSSYMLMDNIVHITVHAADDGGMTVLVPHTENVEIGSLPAGSYSILVDGAFILDSAPEHQHSFNVSGGPDCSILTIESVQWATFTDTTIVVHVTSSAIGFSYPAFVLLDEQGDTLAVETVNLFAIGSESWHTLTVHPGAAVPVGNFNAQLHLWTGFFSELACTWELPLDLCPAQECVTVFPYIQNLGGAIALGTCSWHIMDDGGEVASGQFVLTQEQQMDQDELCLPPGRYRMSAASDQQPTGGQLYFGVFGGASEWGPFMPLASVPPMPLLIDLLVPCSDGTNGIGARPTEAHLIIASTADGLLIRAPRGEQLGIVRLFDSRGSLVGTHTVAGDHIVLRPRSSGMYVIQAAGQTQRAVFTGQH